MRGDPLGTAVNRQETGGARDWNDGQSEPRWVNSASVTRKSTSMVSGSNSSAGVANTNWFAIDMTAQIAHGSLDG